MRLPARLAVAARFVRELSSEWQLGYGGSVVAAVSGIIALLRHDNFTWIVSFTLALGCILWAAFRVYERELSLRATTGSPQIIMPPGISRPAAPQNSTIRIASLGVVCVTLLALSTRGVWWPHGDDGQFTASLGKPTGPVSVPAHVYQGFFQNGTAIWWYQSKYAPGVVYLSSGTFQWKTYPDTPDDPWAHRKQNKIKFAGLCHDGGVAPYGVVGKNLLVHRELLAEFGCLKVLDRETSDPADAERLDDCQVDPNTEISVQRFEGGWRINNLYVRVNGGPQYDYILLDKEKSWTYSEATPHQHSLSCNTFAHPQ